ncbi:hypothetical protein ACQ4PT_020057 [Festuca glaucescens]
MEDLAASSMPFPHSALLYMLYDGSGFPEHHGEPHQDEDGGGFEFAALAKNFDDNDCAAPPACASDVSAFAGEMFRGGVLIPLKLPPRLQRPAASSAATSPTAQLGRVPSWSPFASRRTQRGLDPFAAALEKVRRDGAAPAPRRARSLSPLRGAAAPSSGSRPAGSMAAGQKTSARPTWRRRGAMQFLCWAVMASASAPRALRRRHRKHDGRPGLLVCFGL